MNKPPEDMVKGSEQSPIAAGHGKMSPQAAVGYGNWPDEVGRQSKHRAPVDNGKRKTLRTHRNGSAA
jgi:hypothetical protein